MIPLAVPNLCGNEARYLQECVETTFVSTVGPFVGRFESMVADAAGTNEAIATASGTAGLHLALTAVGVGHGDLVIMPSLTFVATANAAAQCGAMPWLLDIDQESWTLDPARLHHALARETTMRGDTLVHAITGARVAAIVPVYTLGTPANMDIIVDIANAYGVPVVADAAAALGATYKGRPVGRLGAALTMFSFNGNKTVTAGGGGAVTGLTPDLLRLSRHLSTTARVGADYDHDRPGFNYRLTNLQAAVGCAQMEHLDRLVAAKRRIRARYDDAFADLSGITPFPQPAWAESACWFSGFALDPGRADDIPALREEWRAASIDIRPFWKPMHLQAPYRSSPRGALPVSEDIWRRIVTLPCSTHLSEEEQEHVIAVIRRSLKG